MEPCRADGITGSRHIDWVRCEKSQTSERKCSQRETARHFGMTIARRSDTGSTCAHNGGVMARVRCLAVMALSLALASPGPGACSGWLATPDARMACCVDGSHCAMHETTLAAAAGITQASADRCCTMSDADPPPTPAAWVLLAPPAPAVQPVPGTVALLVEASAPSPTPPPLPAIQVPRHLLLSVFII